MPQGWEIIPEHLWLTYINIILNMIFISTLLSWSKMSALFHFSTRDINHFHPVEYPSLAGEAWV
jgi:hypothetical protein